MAASVLLIEPYDALAGVLSMYLEGLGYAVTRAEGMTLSPAVFAGGQYAVVFINLDQGITAWGEAGMKIAETANAAGLPVVMIPDGQPAADILKQSAFVYLKKPFNPTTLDDAIRQAVACHPVTHLAAN